MDYAWGNQALLGNESLFLLPWRQEAERHPVVPVMQKTAPVRFYKNTDEREVILREEGVDFFYCVKNGFHDGVLSRRVPTGVHAIFRESEFHGEVYAYVSPWLAEVMSYGQTPWVPHMVRLMEDDGDMRTEDGGQMPEDGGRWAEGGDRKSVVGDRWPEVAIPREATVFGRHGGDDSFDIPWVQAAVVETARNHPEIWFLFLNTREFAGAAGLPNIRFLPATADPVLKRRFLNTCDAMLHGRQRGETFGLSCLEFAALGKPVLTYADSPEMAHLEILGEAAVPYHNVEELCELLRHPVSAIRLSLGGGGQRPEGGGQKSVVGRRKSEGRRPQTTGNRQPSFPARPWNEKLKDYQPEAVMRKFEQVFLR